MLKPEDVLKAQLANVFGENARLACEVHRLNEENQVQRKELEELRHPKEKEKPNGELKAPRPPASG